MSFFQCTCSFFPEFHWWVQFSLAGEIIFEGEFRGEIERKYSLMQRFLCRRIAWKSLQKWLRRRLGRKSYIMNMMIECLPETSLIALENVHWSTNLLNPAHARIKHTMTCILSNNVVGQTPCKFVAVFVSIFSQREDKEKGCVGRLTTPSLPLLLLPSNMVGYSFTRLKVVWKWTKFEQV